MFKYTLNNMPELEIREWGRGDVPHTFYRLHCKIGNRDYWSPLSKIRKRDQSMDEFKDSSEYQSLKYDLLEKINREIDIATGIVNATQPDSYQQCLDDLQTYLNDQIPHMERNVDAGWTSLDRYLDYKWSKKLIEDEFINKKRSE